MKNKLCYKLLFRFSTFSSTMSYKSKMKSRGTCRLNSVSARENRLTPIFYPINLFIYHTNKKKNDLYTSLFFKEMVKRQKDRNDNLSSVDIININTYYEKKIHAYDNIFLIWSFRIKMIFFKCFQITQKMGVLNNYRALETVERFLKINEHKETLNLFSEIKKKKQEDNFIIRKFKMFNVEDYDSKIEEIKKKIDEKRVEVIDLNLKEKFQRWMLNFIKLYHESLQNLIEGQREVLKDNKFVFDDGESVEVKMNKFEEMIKKKMPNLNIKDNLMKSFGNKRNDEEKQ